MTRKGVVAPLGLQAGNSEKPRYPDEQRRLDGWIAQLGDHPPIPTLWSGDQALEIVDFLEQLIAAIWQLHGEKMHFAAHSIKPGPPDPAGIPFTRFIPRS